MKKQVIINREQYNTVKDIIDRMTCFANGETQIASIYNLPREIAYIILKAVYYNYSYLKIVD